MTIPFQPELFGVTVNIHLILEYLAFFIAFRYYVYLRKNSDDSISSGNRLSIILGAIVGALIGSRFMALMETAVFTFTWDSLTHILNSKTIMGGLFGGLIGVESAKKLIGENQSSGDLFTLPLILGIFIGRIGCFLSGITEFTYGSETTFFMGMDLGDGLSRHPIALYELIFLSFFFFFLKRKSKSSELENGDLFKIFMITYFGFRFFIEFIKPNIFFILGLSSIQWLCIVCWLYYIHSIRKFINHAYQKIYLL